MTFKVEIYDEDGLWETLNVKTLAIASQIATSRLMFQEVTAIKIIKVEE